MRDLCYFVRRFPTNDVYRPPEYCIAPVVGAALIAGASSLAGSAINAASQSSSNSQNLKIAELNALIQKQVNDQNYQYNVALQDRANAFTERMWNLENEYEREMNDPTSVVAKLKQAGLNPYSFYGSPPATDASSVSGAQASFHGQAPVVNYREEPLRFDLSGLGMAANAYFQNQLLNRQASEKDIDTQIKKVQLAFAAQQQMADLMDRMASINEKIENTKVGSAQYDYLVDQREQLNWQLKLFKDTYEDLRDREKKQNDVLDEQRNDLVASAQMKRIQSHLYQLNAEWFPKMQRAQLDVLVAQQSNIVANTANLVLEGKLTSQKETAEYLVNEFKRLELKEAKTKSSIRNDHAGTKTLYYFADYFSDLIFGNVKLFK